MWEGATIYSFGSTRQTVRRQVPPLKRTDTRYNKDAASLLLEKHRKDREQAQKRMDVDKMRHDLTLQEKLARRRELKRRREVAPDNVPVVRDVKPGDTAFQSQDSVAVAAVGEAGVTSRTDAAVVGHRDKWLALGAVAMWVAPGVDRYEEVMAEQAPAPTAPETIKEELYENEDDIELFQDLENFAIDMEQISDPSTTFAILMESLLINQLSDLEKVRILFHWITNQDLNSIVFPDNIDESTPMGFLFAIKQDRKSYPELFCRLCSAAGLHAKVIQGYMKGVGYVPDHKFTDDEHRGSWNAVLIDGQWRLIDTHWGARHVIETDDAEVKSTELETVYRYEEHYFLTNPDQLIVTHYPDVKDWQLLPEPVTLDEFQNVVRVWPLFYKLRLELSSHKNGVIDAPEDGIVRIRILMSDFARDDTTFRYKFMTKQKQGYVGKANLACHVLHFVEGNFQVFQVHVPAVGEYLLRISGNSKLFPEDNFICLYQINCAKLTQNRRSSKNPKDIQTLEISPPFPEPSYPWGPPPSSSIVTQVSHSGPIVTCDEDGEATLVLQVLEDRTLFLQHLYQAGPSTKEALVDRAVHFTTTSKAGSKVVVFRVRTPKNGMYSLLLCAKNENDDKSESYISFCNYLVVSQAQSRPAPPFPPVPSGKLGPKLDLCKDLGLSPEVVKKYSKKSDLNFLVDFGNAWIEPNEDNEAFVSFGHLMALSITAKLEPNSSAGNYNVTDSVNVQDTGRRATITVRPPKFDCASPEYLLTIYAAHSGESSIPVVFQAFVNGAKKSAHRLAQPPNKRWGLSNSLPDAGISIVKYHNSTPMFGIDNQYEESDPSPCRTYWGGKDLSIDFAMKHRLNLMAEMSVIDNTGTFSKVDDKHLMLSPVGLSTVTLRVRIPQKGEYCLELYGKHMDDESEKMPFLLRVRISAESESSSLDLFPQTYNLWSSSAAQLYYPLNGSLKHNTVNKIKVFLAKIENGTECVAFPGVFLFTDQSHTIDPNTSDPSTQTYEWDYVPGPGERNLRLVVQKSVEKNYFDYVLEFEIVK